MLKTIHFLVLILFFGLVNTMTVAQDVTEYTLDNGLKVFLLQDPASALVSVRTYVRAGSITEGDQLGSGLSHYLEHIVAGGTTSKKSEETYKQLLSRMGNAYNAYTTTDHTSYYINTTPEYLADAITTLRDWMFFCEFDTKEFNRERDVIIREIEKNEASVGRQFYQTAQQNFYKFHPLSLPVIGYLENFKAVSREALQRYYREFYVPANMILVVGGRFDEAAVRQHIATTFGTVTPAAPPAQTVFDEPVPFASRYVQREGNTQATHFSMRFSTVDLFSPELYALDLLDFMLGNGEDSILYKRIVEDKKLAYNVACTSYTPSSTNGYFEIAAEIDEKNIEAVRKEILAILKEVKDGRIANRLVERARKQKLAEDILSVNSIEDKVARVGQAYIYGFTKDFFDRYIANFKHVTKDDVVRVARRYFDFDRQVVTVMTPKKEAAPLVTPKEAVQAETTRPVPEMVTLDNGVRVLLFQDDSLPRTSAKIFVLGGLRAETPSNNGIGYLLAELLGMGSEKYSKDAIRRLMEDNGAELGASQGSNTLFYNLDCLSEDFDKLFPVMVHTFLHPVFKTDDLDEVKRKTYQWIDQRKDDWYRYGMYHLRHYFYGAHPYAFPSAGEKETLEPLSVKDIYRHYQTLKTPRQMLVTVFGDFNKERTLRTIKEEFGKIKPPAGAFNAYESLPRTPHEAASMVTETIPQDVAAVFVAFDGVAFKDADVLRLHLADAVLTGMSYPGGRLHSILREKGYVYLVHGVNLAGLEKGMFYIYALTNKNQVEDVKKIIMDQIESIKTTPVTDDEFADAIAQMSFYHKDRASSLESLAMITATDELYGLGYDYFTRSDAEIAALTKADVQRAANAFLRNPQVLVLLPEK